MSKRTDDYDEIVRVVRLYMNGFGKNDIGMFQEAFAEEAWIFYTDADGRLHKNLISNLFEKWAGERDRAYVGRIIAVIQAGDAAVVQLSLDLETNSADTWIDFHTLIRKDGAWKITNKTATHSSR